MKTQFDPDKHKHPLIAVEYSYDSPQHYDGISEYYCKTCNKRWGRWTGKELTENVVETVWGDKP